jgi:recombination protein RecA
MVRPHQPTTGSTQDKRAQAKGRSPQVEKKPTTRSAKKSQKSTSDLSQAKGSSVQAALDEIEKQYGAGAIMKMGEQSHIAIERFPSGSLSLDLALGGGVPKGRIVEIYGPESSGKTTLALHMIAQLQKKGGQAAFIDAEHALDAQYAKRIGVDVDNLLVSQPDDGESALEITETLVRSGGVELIVIDSVAALTPRAEIEGMMGDTHMGLQARLMSQALRKLTAIVAKTNCSVIFINQLRMKIGVMFGNPETTPGGNALKFYSSLRLDVRRIEKITEKTDTGQDIIGNRVRVKVVKNKTAPPFRQAEFDLIYNRGISREGDLLDLGVKYGLITKAGAHFSIDENKLGQGREQAKFFLAEHSDIAEALGKEIMSKASESA